MSKAEQGGRTLRVIQGKSRKDTNWKVLTISWEKLVERLSNSRKTSETHAEYMRLKKDDREKADKIKDIGGFMGGILAEGGRRKAENVKSRSMITLDADNAPADLAERLGGLPECAACIYSTHSHSPEAPRLRLIIPLDREVTPDEHSAISRKVADIIGLEYFDRASFSANQMMYWPSHSKDVEPYFWSRDGGFLCADSVLEMYKHWKDPAEWPKAPGEDPRVASGQKKEDPRTKEGPVGDFCRAYTIAEAIQEYLPDVYEPTTDPNTWKYIPSESAAGLRIYDDVFATSYHATDPAFGGSHNAFDLVRIHKFGKMDRPGEEYGRRTSDSLMNTLIEKNPKVRAERVRAEFAGEEAPAGGDGEGSYSWKLQFHKMTQKGRPVDVIDANIAEYVLAHNQIIVIDGLPYFYEGGFFHLDEKGHHIRALIKTCMFKDLITDQRLTRVLRLIVSEEKLQHSVETMELNKHPDSWINCRNGMLDLLTLELHPHSPEYLSLNQIPFSYDPGHRLQTGSITEEYLEAFIPDQEDREMFLEYAGYCLSPYTGFQQYLILQGDGGIGKSVLRKMIDWLVGMENLCSIKLQRLSDKFSTRFLFGKLLNSVGDLDSTPLKETGNLKMITGDDHAIPAEIKGGKGFQFKPYAKLLFSANRVPISLDEQTKAYYRRILILHLEACAKRFPDLENRLKADIESFFYLAVQAAQRAFKRGHLLNSARSVEEVWDLYFRSDTVMAFLRHRTVRDPKGRILTTGLFDAYESFCMDEDRPPLSRNGFRANLKEKGVGVVTIHGAEYFAGVQLAPPDYEPPAVSWEDLKS